MTGNCNFLTEIVTQNWVILQLNEFKLEFILRITYLLENRRMGFQRYVCVCVCVRARVC